ncbi:S41 family peptidase [Robiginitalea sp. M366]|uniref:S41 family peptidase n=1 Tax=Robiginitalea aestuariiviva TaxID=3036903 RepID=UPI00240E5E83|nr:S41 family peptidase [Robiginitalea aestuariiviva]MDG1573284.1 S41 family peptidase [Robiginitalea aestuariiviva]
MKYYPNLSVLKLITSLILLVSLSGSCQAQPESKEVYGFESNETQNSPLRDWSTWGSYVVTLDSSVSFRGKNSVRIASNENLTDSIGSIYLKIPIEGKGNTVKLSGFIKTQKVNSGYGGLLLWTESNDGQIPIYRNMQEYAVKGTSDWNEYSIGVEVPKNTKYLYIGGYLAGKGILWLDDINLQLEGIPLKFPISEVPTFKIQSKSYQSTKLGSTLSLRELSPDQIKNLSFLAKVWGYLKYNHPLVCGGVVNWDFELLEILPKIIMTRNASERDEILTQWIEQIGTIEGIDSTKTSELGLESLYSEIGWIKDYDPQPSLINSLLKVSQIKCQGLQYYVQVNPGAGNPSFLNEEWYPNVESTDDGFRLLGLFRLWNIVEYFFPYKELIPKEWDDVLVEYIPKFIEVEDGLEGDLNYLALINELNDSHAQLRSSRISNFRGENYAPFKLAFVKDKWLVKAIYNPELMLDLDIQLGDQITHINGKEIEIHVDSMMPYYPSSNLSSKLRDISRDLLRSSQEFLELDILRGVKSIEIDLPLFPRNKIDFKWYNSEGSSSFKLIEESILYVELHRVVDSEIEKIIELGQLVKGVILDARRYPSGSASKLWPQFSIPGKAFAKFTKFNIYNPGEFEFQDVSEIPQSDNERFRGMVIVIVDENTQSLGEFTTMAFQANSQTIVVGSQTAGADGNVSRIPLPGALETGISGIGVFYPDGQATQGVGIKIDIELENTPESIRRNQDLSLIQAIALIKKAIP